MTTSSSYHLYIGSYASIDEPGIHLLSYDAKGQDLRIVDRVSGIANPSFLAPHPDKPILYAASERFGAPGGVKMYAMDRASGHLELQNEQPIAEASPCFVACDQTGRTLIAANYAGGRVTSFSLGANGHIGPANDHIAHVGHGPRTDRQEAPHPHSAIIDHHNRFVLVPDLGIDQIVIYALDAGRSELRRHGAYVAEAGSGPRLFAFHPQRIDGRAVGYAIHELDNTIVAFDYDEENGVLEAIQTISTLPDGFSGRSIAAHLAVSPDGRFLYASNRGHDSIAVYEIKEDGKLRAPDFISSFGQTPRHFAITPDGQSLVVANQDSNNVVVFAIDQVDGLLHPTGEELTIARPTCVLVAPRI